MKEYQIKILGISETKKMGNGKIQIAEKYKMYYSGLDTGHRVKKGVGIIVNDELDSRNTEFKPISSCI